MRRIFSNILISSALLAAGFSAAITASAQQYYDRPGYPESQDRSLFNRVRGDLDRAAAYPYASRADRKRFDEARRDLFDFASRLDQGRYEKHQLNHAIDRVQNVVSHNSLDPRSRGALDEDLRRMRDFRAFRDHHVDRDYSYGYR
jgi:hypothetical protein